MVIRRTLLAALLLAVQAPAELALGQDGADPPPSVMPGPELIDQRPAGGEQCLVCRQQIHEGDIVEVRYKGRSFHVAEKMLAEFEADPDTYFHLLQAHGGLFDEAAMETPPMRIGWLVFGLYVLAGLIAGAACSYIALDRRLPAWPWFFAGLAVNVLAVAAVLTRKPRGAALAGPLAAGLARIPSTHAPISCRRCGETNHPSAAVCGGCSAALEPTIQAETARA